MRDNVWAPDVTQSAVTLTQPLLLGWGSVCTTCRSLSQLVPFRREGLVIRHGFLLCPLFATEQLRFVVQCTCVLHHLVYLQHPLPERGSQDSAHDPEVLDCLGEIGPSRVRQEAAARMSEALNVDPEAHFGTPSRAIKITALPG